jgi:hypothetical protein
VPGIALGHGHLLFAGRVLSVTRPGELRMPNGIECDLPALEPGAPVQVGDGRLTCDLGTVYPGPLWDPRPSPRFSVATYPRLSLSELCSLAGRGPGLTPLGDDILAGYLGARALFGVGEKGCSSLAASKAARTTSLSATLLRLAAHGQLPEAAHRLLEDGDPEPLLCWGVTSGSGLLAGFGCCSPVSRPEVVVHLDLVLPLVPPRLLSVDVVRVSHPSCRAQRCAAAGTP